MPYRHPEIRRRVLHEPGRHKDWRGWAPGIWESLGPEGEPYPEVELMEDWPTFVEIRTVADRVDAQDEETFIDFDPGLFSQLPAQIRHAIILITAELVLDCLTDNYWRSGFEGNWVPPVRPEIAAAEEVDVNELYEIQGELLQRTRDMLEQLFVAVHEPELNFELISPVVENAREYWIENMSMGMPFVYGYFDHLFALFESPEDWQSERSWRPTGFLTIAFMLLITCNRVPFSQFYWASSTQIRWQPYIDAARAVPMSRALIQGWWEVILKRLAFRGWELPRVR